MAELEVRDPRLDGITSLDGDFDLHI